VTARLAFRLHRLVRVATLIAALCLAPRVAAAAEQLLRDAEIENDIKIIASPIWRAAGLEPNDVGIYLVKTTSSIRSSPAGRRSLSIAG
jgi:hypothetical protein